MVGSMHGFRASLTSFVGRAAAVDEVAGQLGQHRLVTVTGPGGAGKTRLAGEVARQVAGRFADGVWLAELAAVRDPAQVTAAVATALGIRDLPSAAAGDALADALVQRQLLLVLDNCEHVIGAAAELCGRLLLAADDVRILATSREPLRITGEARYRLAPLTLPGPEDPAGPGQTLLAGSEAVALFADRARLADSGFTLDAGTAPLVARLVARLDGMPLAIELAAARVEALGVAQLLDRIGERFTLLEAGDRLAAGRQRSLAAAVEWSYRLLDDRERRVFRAASAFPGPFTLDGVEAVAGPGSGPVVLHLVDCSLLVPPRAGPDGRARYVMLETLRAYGAGLLAEAGEGEAAAAALAGYALRVAEDAMTGLNTDTGEVAAAQWLDAEDATMRQVLDWSLARDTTVAARLAAALAWWWQIRGRMAAQTPLLQLAVDRATVGSAAWCLGRTWLGQAALDSADPARALGHFTAVRDAAGDQEPGPLLLARCLAGRAVTLLSMGRLSEAAGDVRRALDLARQGDVPVAEAQALAILGLAACVAGDREGAVQMARQAERITIGRSGPMARVCSHLLTTVLIEADDAGAAERICRAGLDGARNASDLWSLGNLLEKMVVLDLNSGRIDAAAAHLREGLEIALRTGARARLLQDLDCCGYLCSMTGRCADAVTVWEAVIALQGVAGAPVRSGPDVPEGWFQRQEPLREARQALEPGQARAAEERGRVMSLTTAAEYARLLTTAAPEPAPAALDGVSPRERELITLVAQGRTDAQIAGQLQISVRTVSSHLDRIRDKTGCRRRADLTRLALSAGLV
jgi:non-specific serine/threonine protein kinase